MIGVDTSSFVAFLGGEDGADVDLLKRAIINEILVIPPVVVAELFSARDLPAEVKATIIDIPKMSILPGFWERVGEARATLLKAGKKARLADTMIAVFCLDHRMPLIARDCDYRHFVEHFDLDLQPKKRGKQDS